MRIFVFWLVKAFNELDAGICIHFGDIHEIAMVRFSNLKSLLSPPKVDNNLSWLTWLPFWHHISLLCCRYLAVARPKLVCMHVGFKDKMLGYEGV